MIIPQLSSRRAFVALAVASAGLAACMYNWTVGSAPLTTTDDSGTGDATIANDVAQPDVLIPSDARLPPGDEGGADAAHPSDAGTPLCAQLRTTLDDDRTTAKTCSGPASGQCATYVFDECGCRSHVADADSGAANEFAAALGAFAEAGCVTPWCDGGCLLTLGSCYPETVGPDQCFP